jgi:hypothetical protein
MFYARPKGLGNETFYSGKSKGNGKAIPLQAWRGPESSRRLRFPYFKKIDS